MGRWATQVAKGDNSGCAGLQRHGKVMPVYTCNQRDVFKTGRFVRRHANVQESAVLVHFAEGEAIRMELVLGVLVVGKQMNELAGRSIQEEYTQQPKGQYLMPFACFHLVQR